MIRINQFVSLGAQRLEVFVIFQVTPAIDVIIRMCYFKMAAFKIYISIIVFMIF